MADQSPDQFAPLKLWQDAQEPVFWLDSALKIAWVNPAWEALTGHRSQSVVGTICHAHAPTRADDLADLAASFYPPAEALAGRSCGTRVLIYHARGERLWQRVEFWPFRDSGATVIGFLGVVRALDEEPSVPDTEENPLHLELLEIRRQLERHGGFDSILGLGAAHRRLLEQIRLATEASTPVLIVGEAGTGKRHVARVIHQNGPKRNQPLVAFDPEALPAEILERELFGGVMAIESQPQSNAYPAVAGKPRMTLGEGSTLVIREIFTLPRDLQARLSASLDSSIRLIGTSVLDPQIALASERVRPDLYYTLTALVIRLVSLRDRREELPVLAQHFLERANQRGGAQRLGFTPDALAAIGEYDWPGNLGELARVIDQAHSVAGSDQAWIGIEDLPASIRGNLGAAYLPPSQPSPVKPLDQLLIEVEVRAIERALRQARGNKSRAAELLGISRPRLYRRIKELNVADDPEPNDKIPSIS